MQKRVSPHEKYDIKHIADKYGFKFQHHQALDDATVLYRCLTETEMIPTTTLASGCIPFNGYNFL